MTHRLPLPAWLVLLLACSGARAATPAAVPEPARPPAAPAAEPVPAPAEAPAPAPRPDPQPAREPDAAAVPDPVEGPTPPPGAPLSEDEQRLWRKTITVRLARPTWRTLNRYDAAYIYMLPMHAAFERGYAEGRQEVAEHIDHFLLERDSVRLRSEAQISWLQYFYFLSRFVVLASEHGQGALVPPELPEALRGWLEQLWYRGPAWQWQRKPFPGGIRERLEWKLSDAPPLKGLSYEHAILDQELFLFAIAADLRHYGELRHSPLASDSMLMEMRRVARRVYDQRVVWNADSGWTFQPGIWRDHPDHVYECRVEKRPGMPRCPEITGVEDASHTHRFPLWLEGLAAAEPPGSSERAYYERLLRGLERQFFDRVLVPPSPDFGGWRLRNYMNGQNGLYRWGYKQFGPDEGYGPYELSFALLSSWWGFLPGPRARSLYRDLAAEFPLSPALLKVYMGPPPLGRPPGKPNGILVDGTALLLCRLASERP